MFRGFYNLTSGMLSQGRRLDVVSNNITNISTAGYKADHYTDSTFQEVMLSRVGNKDKSRSQEIGQQSYILAPSELFTDYTQGGLEETGLPLDFAIDGEGYFAIDRDGQVAYTRAGSFTLDDEGYLVQEMVSMMTTQRALQSAAQISKIYDQVMTRATTELGRLG